MRKRVILSAFILLFALALTTASAGVVDISIETPGEAMAFLSHFPAKDMPETDLTSEFFSAIDGRFPNASDSFKDPASGAVMPFYNGPERRDYAFNKLQVSVVRIRFRYVYCYLIYDRPYGGSWTLRGLTSRSDIIDDLPYRVEYDYDNCLYWLVLTSETNHGTDTLVNSEIWYNPDGSEAFRYESYIEELFCPYQDVNGVYREPTISSTASVSFVGQTFPTVNVTYNTVFYFDDQGMNEIMRAFDYISYAFDPETQTFIPAPEKSTTLSSSSPTPLTDKYTDFSGIPVEDIKSATTPADWVKLLERMGAKNAYGS